MSAIALRARLARVSRGPARSRPAPPRNPHHQLHRLLITSSYTYTNYWLIITCLVPCFTVGTCCCCCWADVWWVGGVVACKLHYTLLPPIDNVHLSLYAPPSPILDWSSVTSMILTPNLSISFEPKLQSWCPSKDNTRWNSLCKRWTYCFNFV